MHTVVERGKRVGLAERMVVIKIDVRTFDSDLGTVVHDLGEISKGVVGTDIGVEFISVDVRDTSLSLKFSIFKSFEVRASVEGWDIVRTILFLLASGEKLLGMLFDWTWEVRNWREFDHSRGHLMETESQKASRVLFERFENVDGKVLTGLNTKNFRGVLLDGDQGAALRLPDH